MSTGQTTSALPTCSTNCPSFWPRVKRTGLTINVMPTPVKKVRTDAHSRRSFGRAGILKRSAQMVPLRARLGSHVGTSNAVEMAAERNIGRFQP